MTAMSAGYAHRAGMPAADPWAPAAEAKPEPKPEETEPEETEPETEAKTEQETRAEQESEAPVPSPGTPPGTIEIIPMRWWHLPDVAELETRIQMHDTWSQEMFWSELAQGSTRRYLAAVRAGRIVGYAGLAVHADESFVQTLGVDAGERRRGVGSLLLAALLWHARAVGALSCDLEVRADNHEARALYSRFGFVDIGIRRGYYQQPGGDAHVMRVRPINTVGYAALLDAIDPGGGVVDGRSDVMNGPGGVAW